MKGMAFAGEFCYFGDITAIWERGVCLLYVLLDYRTAIVMLFSDDTLDVRLKNCYFDSKASLSSLHNVLVLFQ